MIDSNWYYIHVKISLYQGNIHIRAQYQLSTLSILVTSNTSEWATHDHLYLSLSHYSLGIITGKVYIHIQLLSIL